VVLHVEHNNPARRLYDRLGFQPVSSDEVYVRMEWRAPEAAFDRPALAGESA